MAAMVCIGASAQSDVTLTRNGDSYKMSNGTVSVSIGSNGRISEMTFRGAPMCWQAMESTLTTRPTRTTT